MTERGGLGALPCTPLWLLNVFTTIHYIWWLENIPRTILLFFADSAWEQLLPLFQKLQFGNERYFTTGDFVKGKRNLFFPV